MASSSYLAAWLAMLAVTYLAHSTLLLGGAWLAVKLCRVRSHALGEQLWKLATVIGLATAILQVATGVSRPLAVFVLDSLDRPAAAQVARRTSAQAAETVAAPSGVWQVFDGGAADQLSQGTQPAASAPQTPGNRPEHGEAGVVASSSPPRKAPEAAAGVMTTSSANSRYSAMAGVLVTAWVVLAGVWLAAKAWWCRRFLARARILSVGRARQSLDRFLRRHGIRREVLLLASHECTTPLACGITRWTIVLPAGAEERLRSGELDALFAHELAHLTRGDMLWLWVGRILTACLAFQPLNRLAFRHWQRAAEYLCDDWAVERLRDPLALARCVTQVAAWQSARRRPAVGLAAGGTAGTLVDRVERLLAEAPRTDPWSRKFRRRSITAAAAFITIAFTCWAPRAECSLQPADIFSRRRTGNNGAAVPAAALSARSLSSQAGSTVADELLAEWRALQGDLKRAEALLAEFENQPEIRRAADQIRERMAALDGRLNGVTNVLNAQVSFTEE